MENYDVGQWLILLVPVILIELGLMVIALVDLIRRERTKGPKWVWVLLIMFIGFIGPILYFMMGRED
jgi:hypothetical protein